MEEKHLTRHGRQRDGVVNSLVPSYIYSFCKNASEISTSTARAEEEGDDRILTALTEMNRVGTSPIESLYGLCFVLNFLSYVENVITCTPRRLLSAGGNSPGMSRRIASKCRAGSQPWLLDAIFNYLSS
jgi:hypothetical protein